MKYSVKMIKEPREAFGPYRYSILDGNNQVAVFVHNYRGECESIKPLGGIEQSPPFGMSSEFLCGGRVLPLTLSKNAREYLSRLLKD